MKNGFSLAEALVSMLILSIFFLATYKINTQKESKDTITVPHGFFECYHDGTTLHQRYSYAGDVVNESEPVGNCTFSPQRITSQYQVSHIVNNSGNYIVYSKPFFIDRRAVISINNGSDDKFEVTLDMGNTEDMFHEPENPEKNIMDEESNNIGSLENYHDLLVITQPKSHYASGTYHHPGVIVQW